MTMKIRLNMKINRSHIYGIIRPTVFHEIFDTISILQEIFASIYKIFISGGGLSIRP